MPQSGNIGSCTTRIKGLSLRYSFKLLFSSGRGSHIHIGDASFKPKDTIGTVVLVNPSPDLTTVLYYYSEGNEQSPIGFIISFTGKLTFT